MRTTIEIPDRLRAALLVISAKRGLRGFSKIVEEALDQYLKAQASSDREIADILKLKGAWSKKDAKETREAIGQVRRNWESLS